MLPAAEWLLRTDWLVYFSACHAEVSKGRLHYREAVLEMVNKNVPVGKKIFPLVCWRKQLQGCPCLPADRKVSYSCWSHDRSYPMNYLPLGLEVQVVPPRFLRSLSLCQNRFCMQLGLTPRACEEENQDGILPFWVSDSCNVQFPWNHWRWFMFSWNWAGLMPWSVALMPSEWVQKRQTQALEA